MQGALPVSAPGALQSQHVLTEEQEEKEEEWVRWQQERALMLAQVQTTRLHDEPGRQLHEGFRAQLSGRQEEEGWIRSRGAPDGEVCEAPDIESRQRWAQARMGDGGIRPTTGPSTPSGSWISQSGFEGYKVQGDLRVPLLASSPPELLQGGYPIAGANRGVASSQVSSAPEDGHSGRGGGQRRDYHHQQQQQHRQICPNCHGLVPPADGRMEPPHVMASYCQCYSD